MAYFLRIHRVGGRTWLQGLSGISICALFLLLPTALWAAERGEPVNALQNEKLNEQPNEPQNQVPGEPPVAIRFQDFFKLPIADAGLEPSAALLAANGKRVEITGFMVQREVPAPGSFFLTPRPVQMSEHADGDADDLPPAMILVQLPQEQREWLIPHTRGRIAIEGVLHVGREEGLDGRVTWVRMQLGPDAMRPMNPMQWLGYLHAQQHQH